MALDDLAPQNGKFLILVNFFFPLEVIVKLAMCAKSSSIRLQKLRYSLLNACYLLHPSFLEKLVFIFIHIFAAV